VVRLVWKFRRSFSHQGNRLSSYHWRRCYGQHLLLLRKYRLANLSFSYRNISRYKSASFPNFRSKLDDYRLVLRTEFIFKTIDDFLDGFLAERTIFHFANINRFDELRMHRVKNRENDTGNCCRSMGSQPLRADQLIPRRSPYGTSLTQRLDYLQILVEKQRDGKCNTRETKAIYAETAGFAPSVD
jgi:hypothetical protein